MRIKEQTAINMPVEGTITQRVLKGLFWTFTGTGAEFILQACVLLFLARLIPPEEFGIVGAAMVVVNFSAIFSQLGLGPALVRHPNLERRHIDTGFALSILMGLSLTICVMLASPMIADFFHMEDLSGILMVLSIVFTMQGISVVSESLIKRELNVRFLTIVEVSSFAVGYGIFGLSLGLLKFGAWTLVGATLIQALMKSLLMFLLKPHRRRIRPDRQSLKELFYFGSGLTLGRIFLYFANQGDNLVVGRWLGAEALGLYGRAYQMMAIPAGLFTRVMDKVFFPALSKIQDHQEQLGAAFKRSVALTALCVLPSSAVMFVLAPEIILVFLGAAWQGAVLPFRILVLGMYFRTAHKMSGALARAKGAVYELAWRHWLYGVMVLTGAWLAKSYGISGVAIAVVCALMIYYFLVTILGLRIANVSLGEFLHMHKAALNSTIILFILTWTIALLLRRSEFPPLMIIGIALVAVFLGLLICYRCWPGIYFGKDGLWFLATVVEKLNRIISKTPSEHP